jgi:hypothetical protein
MPYSFIEPVSKSPFSPWVRRVWFGGTLLLAVVLALSFFLHFKSGEQRSIALQERQARESLRVQVEQLQQQQTQFEREKVLRQQIDTANQLLADRLSDLLDLVPGDATLERFEMNSTSVLYAGECRRFKTLKADLLRAFSGQFRLAESVPASARGRTHFILRFTADGGAL